MIFSEGPILFKDLSPSDKFFTLLTGVNYSVSDTVDSGFTTRMLRASYSPDLIFAVGMMHDVDFVKEIETALMQEVAFEIKTESDMPENVDKKFLLFMLDTVKTDGGMQVVITYKIS